MTDNIKCPICGAETTLRTAKKGPNAGEQFNVCMRYPECKGRVSCTPKHSIGSLFKRKHKLTLSEIQGVPEGTFRCDVCKFIQPFVYLCGAVIESNSGWDEYSHRPTKESSILYELCSVCAVWLGFEKTRFPQGCCFGFDDEQHEKINALHKELDINKIMLAKIVAMKTQDYELIHEHMSQIPNLKELLQLRWSILPENIRELSDKLTRGEHVSPSEILKINTKFTHKR